MGAPYVETAKHLPAFHLAGQVSSPEQDARDCAGEDSLTLNPKSGKLGDMAG
jgi:hypothetical protein